MIISHTHEFIFLKPRKVAGTSIEIALSKFLDESDIVTRISADDEADRVGRGYLGARNYKKSLRELVTGLTLKDLKSLARCESPQKYYNHISAAHVRDLIGLETWERYKKISVVRNPWDYAISFFFYANGRDTEVDFDRWCIQNSKLLKRNIEQYQIDNEIVVDHFIRFEDFHDDMLKLEDSIPGLVGLYDTFRSISAKGGIRPKKGASVQEFFSKNSELDDLFLDLFEFEIDRFGYTKAQCGDMTGACD